VDALRRVTALFALDWWFRSDGNGAPGPIVISCRWHQLWMRQFIS